MLVTISPSVSLCWLLFLVVTIPGVYCCTARLQMIGRNTIKIQMSQLVKSTLIYDELNFSLGNPRRWPGLAAVGGDQNGIKTNFSPLTTLCKEHPPYCQHCTQISPNKPQIGIYLKTDLPKIRRKFLFCTLNFVLQKLQRADQFMECGGEMRYFNYQLRT